MEKIIDYEQILKNIYDEANIEDKDSISGILEIIKQEGGINPHLQAQVEEICKKYRPKLFE